MTTTTEAHHAFETLAAWYDMDDNSDEELQIIRNYFVQQFKKELDALKAMATGANT